MIDWLPILLALAIIAILVGIFAFMAWKINMPDPLLSANLSGKKEDANQLFDTEKKRKDKHGNDQSRKKRKDQKKSKRENKEDDQQQHTVKFKEPSTQTSEETDNEREESEQESSTPQVVETSSKVRNRHKKKARPATPPSPAGPIEGILVNKDEKSPVTSHAQPIPHPKLAVIKPKDEVELARLHQQQARTQGKPTQGSNKQTASVTPPPPIPVKRSVPTSTNANQGGQKQQQLLQEQQEQPFTTVGGNRHKAGTPPSQPQNKSVNVTSAAVATTVAAPVAVSTPPVQQQHQQQQAPVQNQHEQLPQRPAPPRQQKETPTQLNGFNANSQPVKQPVVTSAAPPIKLADLVKALPSSQAVVTELMSALDVSSLSADELDIIMHKIANKQAVINKDWSRLQHGQKVDPQAHIGQVLDESARAFEADMKANALQRIKELTDELSNDKRRINELIKDTNDKDLNIQVLHAQLSTIQHPQQQQMQTFHAEFQRLSEENMQLKQRLAQQQHFQQQQQQQFSPLSLANNSGGEAGSAQLRVISEQIKKLSVDNGNFEKQLKAKDLSLKEGQKEKEDLIRTNQQLLQKAQESQKQYQHNEEKLLKELNETRTLNINQLNEYKRRIEQLESEKEQLRRAEAASALSNEDREKLERLTKENEQYKSKLNEIQSQYQSQESQLRQEIDQLRSKSEEDKTLNDKLTAANAQLDALRAELAEAKAVNDSNNAQLEQEKYKQFLLELLEQDAKNQLPNDSQDFNQWLSSYRQILTSNIEANKRTLENQSAALQRENDQLHQNMSDVENQLKEIEQTVQSKEEVLLADLKNKDAIVENTREENEQLNGELQRLRAEIARLQLAHDTAVNDNRALQLQLDERHLVNANSPSTTAISNVDDSTVSSSSDQQQAQS